MHRWRKSAKIMLVSTLVSGDHLRTLPLWRVMQFGLKPLTADLGRAIPHHQPVIQTMPTGEILFHSWGFTGSDANAVYSASIEYTFPLEFAELVWSDGTKVGRKLIDLTNTTPFETKTFKIPSTRQERNGCASRYGIQRAHRWGPETCLRLPALRR
jgi:hypothetical protein